MEFKRFYEFYTNENLTEFHTYLPIQLDATCNGFQHMALLSNEETLFKELNLVPSENPPHDFYNFLLYKLTSYYEERVAQEEPNTEKHESYKRLLEFV